MQSDGGKIKMRKDCKSRRWRLWTLSTATKPRANTSRLLM